MPQNWVRVREILNRSRAELGVAASGHYAGVPRVGPTPLLCRPEWIPAAPVPLESVRLEWDAHPAPPAVTGAGPVAGFATYAQAMGALAPPAVFEDRPAYRLLAADLTGSPVLRLSAASYFDGVDIGEAVAHELAAGAAGLPLRSRIGDPCDLSRRTAVPAITTVTIRRTATGAEYVRHWRDPAKVAHAGGLYQVMPVGVFQPGPAPAADFDLWRSMAREFSEEFLGTAEDYGPDFSYESWPFFQRLSAAREAGGVSVHCLGLGVDPLTLAVDILTAAVFEAEAFDSLFHGLVRDNQEGSVAVVSLAGESPRPMQPAGAAALHLARPLSSSSASSR